MRKKNEKLPGFNVFYFSLFYFKSSSNWGCGYFFSKNLGPFFTMDFSYLLEASSNCLTCLKVELALCTIWIIMYQTIYRHMGLTWVFTKKKLLGIESNKLLDLFLIQKGCATWLSPMQIHVNDFFLVLFFFFFLSFLTKFGPHIWHLTFVRG